MSGLIHRALRRTQQVASRARYYGSARLCPLCGRSARCFVPFGNPPRDDARCVHCGSLERHRFFWLFVQQRPALFDGRPKTMLHIAPEPCLEARLRKQLGHYYLTADLLHPRAMVRMDVTDIQYPDESFDVIYCSHVLEHVPDDRRAMRELRRVLTRDGWAVLNVPITSKATIEDPSIVDPLERLRVFGQEDHVRRYGPDYVDRLREAGFAVETVKVGDVAGRADAVRMGLTRACGDIYYCRK